MIRRTLIPLDGSKLAERAIPHLLRFVEPDRTELLLMTAMSSASSSLLGDTTRLFMPGQAALSKECKAGKQMDIVAQQLCQAGFNVANRILSGAPAASILHLAEEAYVDLIAMSTHGRTGVGQVLLGSVADEVVRNARPPVFLVPAAVVVKSDPLPRTILLPLDGTPLAETAIPVAIHFSQNTGATLYLIRVVEPDDSVDELQDAQILASLDYAGEQPVIRQAISYLERIRLRLQLAGVSSCSRIAAGDPADVINRIVHAEDADLIVMSTHGRSGVERMIHGSVVSRIISNTICPLLLMRGKVPAEIYERTGNEVSAASFC